MANNKISHFITPTAIVELNSHFSQAIWVFMTPFSEEDPKKGFSGIYSLSFGFARVANHMLDLC